MEFSIGLALLLEQLSFSILKYETNCYKTEILDQLFQSILEKPCTCSNKGD